MGDGRSLRRGPRQQLHGPIMIHGVACPLPVVQNCALTGRVPEDLPSCCSACFYFTLSYGPLLPTNLRSLLPCELACFVHQYRRVYIHSNLMLRILILSIVVARSRELTSIWLSVSMVDSMPEKQACHKAASNLHMSLHLTFNYVLSIGMFLKRNCTLHNAIQSRYARVGPGVGVGVDIKTPTPESESTPMKTLSTPQPWWHHQFLIYFISNTPCSLKVSFFLDNYWVQTIVRPQEKIK